MKRRCQKGAWSDGRSTFMVRMKPTLLVDAFANASLRGRSFADWLEEAVVHHLAGDERPHTPDAAEVGWFCDCVENDVEHLPAHLRAAHAAVSGAAWERYWTAPRVTLGQLENGEVGEEHVAPRLNRRRVAEDWHALSGDLR